MAAYGRGSSPLARQRAIASVGTSSSTRSSLSSPGTPASANVSPPRCRLVATGPEPIPGPASAAPAPRNSVITPCLCDPEGYETNLVRGARITYNDSSALRLRRRALIHWNDGSPSKVLIVKKPKNPEASKKLQQIGRWLRERGLQVFVEKAVHATEFKEFDCFDPKDIQVDFCITLGGDGTVLYLASLFEEDEPLPPVLCFAMGTLGFLTPFDASNFEPCLERVLDTTIAPLYCTLRTRKRCEVVADAQLEAVHHVLNECVLDRGAFPGAVLLEIFVDGSYVTNVEADGLIISTPSGSTAYSMSAGGPVVAPSVPCTILTPIAPLSLSFRPIVLPESSSICVHLPTVARSHARASFDGRRPMRVRRGTSIFFTTSLCPLPIISLGRMDMDWYDGITSKLKWNQAIRRLPAHPSAVGKSHQVIGEQLLMERTGLVVCPAPDGSSNGAVGANGWPSRSLSTITRHHGGSYGNISAAGGNSNSGRPRPSVGRSVSADGVGLADIAEASASAAPGGVPGSDGDSVPGASGPAAAAAASSGGLQVVREAGSVSSRSGQSAQITIYSERMSSSYAVPSTAGATAAAAAAAVPFAAAAAPLQQAAEAGSDALACDASVVAPALESQDPADGGADSADEQLVTDSEEALLASAARAAAAGRARSSPGATSAGDDGDGVGPGSAPAAARPVVPGAVAALGEGGAGDGSGAGGDGGGSFSMRSRGGAGASIVVPRVLGAAISAAGPEVAPTPGGKARRASGGSSSSSGGASRPRTPSRR